MSLRDAFAPSAEQPPEVPARIGLNLGPVRLVRDLNGRPNIIGDGINVAQRVMAFADAGQILVSLHDFFGDAGQPGRLWFLSLSVEK